MKLLVYLGKETIAINGVKFTAKIPTANVSDSKAEQFIGNPDFKIFDIEKGMIVLDEVVKNARVKKSLQGQIQSD